MATDGVGQRLDFAEIYRDHLVSVWRYVRSRIRDHHEAQDVTSEVFARAWRSWGRYDPGRGEVAPWLLRIAQRTVIDWNRSHAQSNSSPAFDIDLVENVQTGPGELPEAILLAKEVLAEVSVALSRLSDRERDGIALRFGAGLRMADVGRVLGLSTGATKMMIARALGKVAATTARNSSREAAPQEPVLLDAMVEQALERGQSVLSQEGLRGLALQFAVLHRPKLPDDLPKQVQFCVDCASNLFSRGRTRRPPADRERRQRPHRFGAQPSVAFSWAPSAPLCLACTIPVLVAPLLALGMSIDIGYALHALSLFTAPLVFLVVWRHFRRHQNQLAVGTTAIGALLLAAHLVGHLVVPDGMPGWSVVADRLGTGLLLAGTLFDAVALRSWLITQRQRLEAAATSFRLAPA